MSANYAPSTHRLEGTTAMITEAEYSPLSSVLSKVREESSSSPRVWWDSLADSDRDEIRELLLDPAIPGTDVLTALSSEDIPETHRWRWSDSSFWRIAYSVRAGRL